MEEQTKEDLKSSCEKEINAAKIRFDNELGKQNGLMQSKNDELVNEIKKLNDVIRIFQEEKNDLLKRIYMEKGNDKDISKVENQKENSHKK